MTRCSGQLSVGTQGGDRHSLLPEMTGATQRTRLLLHAEAIAEGRIGLFQMRKFFTKHSRDQSV